MSNKTIRSFIPETAVHHISKEDKKDILWRGSIDIVDPENPKKTIRNCIKLLLLY